MNRLGFLILSVMSSSDAADKASAMTAREIMAVEDFGYKSNTVYKKLSEFEAAGYVAAGYKEGKSKTFYITEKGSGILRNAK